MKQTATPPPLPPKKRALKDQIISVEWKEAKMIVPHKKEN